MSSLGVVSHQLAHETITIHNNTFFLPLMQITNEKLPGFSEFFGSAKMLSIFLPENIIYDEGVMPEIRQYDHLESLIKLKMPQEMLLLGEIYLIEWEKVIDYPHYYHTEYYYPEELNNIIHEAYEDFETEHEKKYGNIPDMIDFEYCKLFPNFEVTKIGGYPTDVQLGYPRELPKHLNFIMQVCGDDFENAMMLGDGGILYIMKDTRSQKWFFDHGYW